MGLLAGFHASDVVLARFRSRLRARSGLAATAGFLLLALAGGGLLLAQGGQSVEVQIDVPGIGQSVAAGPYLFKFTIVEPESGSTLWSSDGTVTSGTGEPRSALQIFVENGHLRVLLGDFAGSPLPPIPSEILQREDVVLRTWVSNAASTHFRRLPDRKLRGKGFAYAAEQARNAERLEGRRASEFETAGAIARHEERHVHWPAGTIPGGRFYNGQSDVGPHRSIAVHFDVVHEESRISLTLHASPPAAAPAFEGLRIESKKTENVAVGASTDVVDVKGSGWLAGIRESWDWCTTCFKRKTPPETDVYVDGTAYDGWKAGRPAVPEGGTAGRLDHLAPVGFLRFERSLKVTLKNAGADQATGSTVVWYYVAERSAQGAPGALQILVDGGDVTSALVGLPDAATSFRTALGRMLASRYDSRPQPADGIDFAPFLVRPADATWLARGTTASGRSTAPGGQGGALLLVGEVALQAGDRRFGIEAKTPAALEVLIENRWVRAVALTAAGTADAAVHVPASGWYQVRALATGTAADLSIAWLVDGSMPRVRTVPLLGGEGAESWSTGPLDLSAAGIPLPPGPHVLTLRERSGRSGHLEYGLLVE